MEPRRGRAELMSQPGAAGQEYRLVQIEEEYRRIGTRPPWVPPPPPDRVVVSPPPNDRDRRDRW